MQKRRKRSICRTWSRAFCLLQAGMSFLTADRILKQKALHWHEHERRTCMICGGVEKDGRGLAMWLAWLGRPVLTGLPPGARQRQPRQPLEAFALRIFFAQRSAFLSLSVNVSSCIARLLAASPLNSKCACCWARLKVKASRIFTSSCWAQCLRWQLAVSG